MKLLKYIVYSIGITVFSNVRHLEEWALSKIIVGLEASAATAGAEE